MSQRLHAPAPAEAAWCGRSWAGLVERRSAAFAQAGALRRATDRDASRVLADFLTFFETTGIGLLRDEEEWVFRALLPTPRVVLEALEDHIAIASLVCDLVHGASEGGVDLASVHRLGALIESHLLMEEEEVRPLTLRTSISARGR